MEAPESADKQLYCVFVCKRSVARKMWGCVFEPPSVCEGKHGAQLALNFVPQFPHCQTSFQRFPVKAAQTEHYSAMKPFGSIVWWPEPWGGWGSRAEAYGWVWFFKAVNLFTCPPRSSRRRLILWVLIGWGGLSPPEAIDWKTRGRNRSEEEKSKKRSNTSEFYPFFPPIKKMTIMLCAASRFIFDL